jgi:hypothetical protein
MKSKVFKIAHQIKSQFENFSKALTAAWKIVKLSLGFAVQLMFAKECGEVREATAIAMSTTSTLEKGYFKFVEQIEGGTQWRACRLERMIFNS